MIIFIFALVIYIVSAWAFWKYIQVSHSEGGRYESIEPDGTDILIMLMPLYNTFFAIFSWVEGARKKGDCGKFFRIKK